MQQAKHGRTGKVQRGELAAAAVAGYAEARQVQLLIERAAFVPGVASQLLEQAFQESNLTLRTLVALRGGLLWALRIAGTCTSAASALRSRGHLCAVLDDPQPGVVILHDSVTPARQEVRVFSIILRAGLQSSHQKKPS